MFDEGKDEQARTLQAEQLRPLEIDALRCVMNYRYYALSAFSFRQHILSGFYVRMKTTYINKPQDGDYRNFMTEYSGIIKQYHRRITPLLVEADY